MLLPAGNQIVALVQGFQHAGDLIRVVLQIAVHRDDGVATGQREAIRERLGFTEIAPVLDGDHIRIAGAQPGDFSPGAVGRAIVDEEDFPGNPGFRKHRRESLMELGQIAFFVHDWNHDRNGSARWPDIRHGAKLDRRQMRFICRKELGRGDGGVGTDSSHQAFPVWMRFISETPTNSRVAN